MKKLLCGSHGFTTFHSLSTPYPCSATLLLLGEDDGTPKLGVKSTICAFAARGVEFLEASSTVLLFMCFSAAAK